MRDLVVSYDTLYLLYSDTPEVARAPITAICTGECCANPDAPNQPVDQALLDSTKVQVGKNIVL